MDDIDEGPLVKDGLLELRDGGDGSLLPHPRPSQAALRREEVTHFQSGNLAFSSLVGFY